LAISEAGLAAPEEMLISAVAANGASCRELS
jgi:hypothetical protein